MSEMSEALEVGKKLTEHCRKGEYLKAVDTLYAPNIVSIEPMSMPNLPARMEGIDAIRKKNVWFFDNHEIHSTEVMGPFAKGNQFVVHFKYEITSKVGPYAGKRMKMEEGALYTVKNGKVAQEEFFSDKEY